MLHGLILIYCFIFFWKSERATEIVRTFVWRVIYHQSCLFRLVSNTNGLLLLLPPLLSLSLWLVHRHPSDPHSPGVQSNPSQLDYLSTKTPSASQKTCLRHVTIKNLVFSHMQLVTCTRIIRVANYWSRAVGRMNSAWLIRMSPNVQLATCIIYTWLFSHVYFIHMAKFFFFFNKGIFFFFATYS